MRRTALFMPSLLVAVIAGMSSAPQVASGASHRTDRQRLLVLKAKVRDLKEQVRREVVHSEYVLTEAGVPYQHEAIVAQAALSYVVGHVSAPAYGYMNKTLGIRPQPTAEGVLTVGAGICGHAALTFAAIVKRFKIPVRSVQFYYADGVNNHIADEVFYAGAWHYFDPTWGAVYEDAGGHVLSIDEARAD